MIVCCFTCGRPVQLSEERRIRGICELICAACCEKDSPTASREGGAGVRSTADPSRLGGGESPGAGWGSCDEQRDDPPAGTSTALDAGEWNGKPRRAHNPQIAGSTPAPATSFFGGPGGNPFGGPWALRGNGGEELVNAAGAQLARLALAIRSERELIRSAPLLLAACELAASALGDVHYTNRVADARIELARAALLSAIETVHGVNTGARKRR